MFGISGFELFIIVVFIIIVFGPNKLPEIIKIAGLAIKKLRNVKEEMDSVLHEEIIDPVMKVANDKEVQSIKDDVKKLESGLDIKNLDKDKGDS